MRKEFENYLISCGYREITPSGLPSTVYSYIKSIDKVCMWEGFCSWQQLYDNIGAIVFNYDMGGAKEDLGNKSHKTIINALKRFKDFVEQ